MDRKYTKVCHLGTKHCEDQRLAHDQDGNWYLYDWSGHSPDTTDDGPLRIDLSRAIEVDDYARVPVVTEDGRRTAWTGVELRNLPKLLRAVFVIPETRGGMPRRAWSQYAVRETPKVVFTEKAADVLAIAKLLGAQ